MLILVIFLLYIKLNVQDFAQFPPGLFEACDDVWPLVVFCLIDRPYGRLAIDLFGGT